MKIEDAIYNICKSIDENKLAIAYALKSVLKKIQ